MERMEILMNYAALASVSAIRKKRTQKKVSDFRFFHHSENELCQLIKSYLNYKVI